MNLEINVTVAQRTPEEELLPELRAWILRNYEHDGLDIVHECWEDKDVLEAIKGSRTLLGAKRKILAAIRPVHDYRLDIQSA